MAGLRTLYVYVMRDCEVCAEAKPIVEEFKRENLFRVFTIYVNATNNIISLADIDPKSTPAYALVDTDQTPLKKFEGLLSKQQLKDFVFGDFGAKIKNKRVKSERGEDA